MREKVLTSDDISKLYQLEIDNLGPDETSTEEDYQSFVKQVTGMTVKEYCCWRNPDAPCEQLRLAIKILK